MKFAGVGPSIEEEEQFFSALGKAITDWAHLEDELFGIVAAILKSDIRCASIVFYRTPSIEARLTLASDLWESRFPKLKPGDHPHPSIKEWKKLEADIRSALPVRNRLAHHPAVPILYSLNDTQRRSVRIKPGSQMSFAEGLRKGGLPMPLDIADVQAHSKMISSLINRLRNYKESESLKPPPKFWTRRIPRSPRRNRRPR
jgi:hypothetical protein